MTTHTHIDPFLAAGARSYRKGNRFLTRHTDTPIMHFRRDDMILNFVLLHMYKYSRVDICPRFSARKCSADRSPETMSSDTQNRKTAQYRRPLPCPAIMNPDEYEKGKEPARPVQSSNRASSSSSTILSPAPFVSLVLVSPSQLACQSIID